MKRKLIATLLSCILLVTLLTGCGAKSPEDNVVTIQISEESKTYLEENIKTDGVKELFSEGVIESVLEYRANNVEQSFPDCTVSNPLNSYDLQGSSVYTLTPDDYDCIVLYTHGGGWISGISPQHVNFCDLLATALNAKVVMPLYPLAPNATSEETYEMIEALYKELLQEELPIYIMGDSAGGNITLGLMYEIKAEGLTMPDKMVLIAPCSDMSFTNEEIYELDKTDPELVAYGCALCAKTWAGEENLKNPKNSAVYADVTGYPDTLLIQGTVDLLGPDNFILYQHLKDAGVNATLIKGEGFWHVFPIYPIQEQSTVLDFIKEFCGNLAN